MPRQPGFSDAPPTVRGSSTTVINLLDLPYRRTFLAGCVGDGDLREREPALLNRPAQHGRERKKTRQAQWYFHCACKIASREAAARLISKRRRKQFRAFTRIKSCSSGEVCNQRSIKRVVPAKSSGST